MALPRPSSLLLPLTLLCLALIALGMIGPQVAAITREAMQQLPVNQHALDRHGALAILAKETLSQCKPEDVRHLDGTGDFAGFELWACQMPNTVKVAIYVCVTSGECTRTVSSYVSRNWEYVDNLLATGKYIIK